MRKISITALTVFASVIGTSLAADMPEIVDVEVKRVGAGWRFDVTVSHADSGWDHYVDGWSIHAPDGRELGYRKLLHPHENEQPFTRSLTGVLIPPGTTQVTVTAHDTVHGDGPTFDVDLPGD